MYATDGKSFHASFARIRLYFFCFLYYAVSNEKGYNPINQIVGYLLSEDPTYITNHNNARSLICKIDRDELMQELVQFYLDN